MNTKGLHLLPKLESAFAKENWNELLSFLDPKIFSNSESQECIAFPVLAKVVQILTTEDLVIPNNIKIACLKCLGNSCLNNYIHKDYPIRNTEEETCNYKLYSNLANNDYIEEQRTFNYYPFDSHFPYEGVIAWTSNSIKYYKVDSDITDEKLEILRLSIQFLCNLFTFAYEHNNQCDIPKYLYDTNLKDVIISTTHSEYIPIVRASCIFIHNVYKKFGSEIFTKEENKRLCSQLLKPIKDGFQSAKEALMLLLCLTDVLQSSYNDMIAEDKLYLLELIYNELSNSIHQSKEEYTFTKDTIEFFVGQFFKKSDLILNTVDEYSDEMEAIEIVILLDILGILTSGPYKEPSLLMHYKRLLEQCTNLLKAFEIIGKQSDNYFTPLRKLSDVASAMQENSKSETDSNGVETKENESEMSSTNSDLHSHPAFGFKAKLIRIIGNMSYKNKECQDLLNKMDAIPLLLDCCNIDARNPLIMQWTILALRNLCEDNPANQEIIRNCTRVGIVESSVLQEMGVTLHEDEEGKRIGIVPLPRE